MKNKKSIYVLIPVVLLIWGLVISKFISFSNPEVSTTVKEDFSLEPLTIKEKDSLVITVNYRDPFLGKMYVPVKAKTNTNNVKGKINRIEPIVWPNVIYKGMVSDTKSKQKVFMLIINGQFYLMKEKDTEQDITLKSGNRESIVVNYMGDLSTILILE